MNQNNEYTEEPQYLQTQGSLTVSQPELSHRMMRQSAVTIDNQAVSAEKAKMMMSSTTARLMRGVRGHKGSSAEPILMEDST